MWSAIYCPHNFFIYMYGFFGLCPLQIAYGQANSRSPSTLVVYYLNRLYHGSGWQRTGWHSYYYCYYCNEIWWLNLYRNLNSFTREEDTFLSIWLQGWWWLNATSQDYCMALPHMVLYLVLLHTLIFRESLTSNSILLPYHLNFASKAFVSKKKVVLHCV